MKKIKTWTAGVIIAATATGVFANNAPPFEDNPEQLWTDAAASGEMVYIDNVAATPSTTETSPEASALMNALMHLNKHQDPPLPWLGQEGFQALRNDANQHLDEKFGDKDPDREPDEVTSVFMEKLNGLAESMGFSMLDEAAAEALSFLDEWVQVLHVADDEHGIDDAIAVPPMGVILAWRFDQNYLNAPADMHQLAAATEEFMNDFVFNISANVAENADFAAYETAIDQGVPTVVKIDGRFMTGVGYWQDGDDNDYLIVHDPQTSEMRVDIVDEAGQNYAYSAEFVGEADEDIVPGCQFVKWQNGMQMDLLELGDWERDFDILWDEAEQEVN